jgi:hypothetical protein
MNMHQNVPDDDRDVPEAEPIVRVAERVAVPRRVLYLQAVLLAAVGICAFLLGLWVRRDNTRELATDAPRVQPCTLRGAVSYRGDARESLPDGGAVVILLPQVAPTDEKLTTRGLLPQDAFPGEDHPGLAALRSVGGQYVRTDGMGRFELRVPNRGQYFLLIISAHQRQGTPVPPRRVRAEVGRFFRLTPVLFAGQAFCWQEEQVQQDRQLNVVIE